MTDAKDWLEAELAESFDEEFELDLEDAVLSREISRIYRDNHPEMIDRKVYFQSLIRLQADLMALLDAITARFGAGGAPNV